MNEKQLNDLVASNRAVITERNKAYWDAYREANAEKIKARNAAYNAVVAANAEKVLAYHAAYNAANAEKLKVHQTSRMQRYQQDKKQYDWLTSDTALG